MTRYQDALRHVAHLLIIAGSTLAVAPALAASSSGAAITGTSRGGVGFIAETSGSNGIGALIGEWDTPYAGGLRGPPQGGEPSGPSIWSVNIAVNDGGIVAFNYQVQTWDGGPYDWLTVELRTPTGNTVLVPHYGNPSPDWGLYYVSPVVAVSKDLTQWAHQSVQLVFTVQQDGWGDETQAIITGVSIRSCGVAPLSPLAPDQATQSLEAGGIDTADLTAQAQGALACFRSTASSAGGSFSLTSAYRTPGYQSHLREVWDKWQLLKDNSRSECQIVKGQVQQEFNGHGLGASSLRPASPSGRHTQGIAIDGRVARVNPDTTAQSCGLLRPFIATDPVHYETH